MSAGSPTAHGPLAHQAKTGRPSVGRCSPTIPHHQFSLDVRLDLAGNEAWRNSGYLIDLLLPRHHQRGSVEHEWKPRDSQAVLTEVIRTAAQTRETLES